MGQLFKAQVFKLLRDQISQNQLINQRQFIQKPQINPQLKWEIKNRNRNHKIRSKCFRSTNHPWHISNHQ